MNKPILLFPSRRSASSFSVFSFCFFPCLEIGYNKCGSAIVICFNHKFLWMPVKIDTVGRFENLIYITKILVTYSI